jgi:hypothetical protein
MRGGGGGNARPWERKGVSTAGYNCGGGIWLSEIRRRNPAEHGVGSLPRRRASRKGTFRWRRQVSAAFRELLPGDKAPTALIEVGGWSHGLRVLGTEAVLVTGGYGGLGLCLAEHLVGVGARRLVLCGRRGPTAEAEAVIAKMVTAGATVVCERCDVADEAQVPLTIHHSLSRFCASFLLRLRLFVSVCVFFIRISTCNRAF